MKLFLILHAVPDQVMEARSCMPMAVIAVLTAEGGASCAAFVAALSSDSPEQPANINAIEKVASKFLRQMLLPNVSLLNQFFVKQLLLTLSSIDMAASY